MNFYKYLILKNLNLCYCGINWKLFWSFFQMYIIYNWMMLAQCPSSLYKAAPTHWTLWGLQYYLTVNWAARVIYVPKGKKSEIKPINRILTYKADTAWYRINYFVLYSSLTFLAVDIHTLNKCMIWLVGCVHL